MKSVTRGNAGQDASLPDSGAMPVMARDDAFGDGGSSRPGGQDPGRVPLRELMDDRLLDALLDRSKDAAGGLRLTGEGSRPYPGAARPWPCKCERCGRESTPRYANVSNGSGCRYCGSERIRQALRLDADEAETAMRDAGVEPWTLIRVPAHRGGAGAARR